MMPDTNKAPTTHKKDPLSRDEYIKKLDGQAKEWDTSLAQWRSKADKGTPEARTEFHKWHREFGDKRSAMQKKVDTMRTGAADAYDTMKADIDSVWTEVKTQYESAKKRYG